METGGAAGAGGGVGRVARLLLPLTAVNNRAAKTMNNKKRAAQRPSAG